MIRPFVLFGFCLVLMCISPLWAADSEHVLLQVRIGPESLEMLDAWLKKGPVRQKQTAKSETSSYRLTLRGDGDKVLWSLGLNNPFRLRVPLPHELDESSVASVQQDSTVLLIRLPVSALPGRLVFERAETKQGEKDVEYVEAASLDLGASPWKKAGP